MDKDTFYKFLMKIPKTEIHLHSEALISRETATEILSRNDPKYNDKKAVDKLFSYNDLKGFIKLFLLLQNGFEKITDFEKLFKSILPYLKRNGIAHSELFFSPSNFIKNGIKFQDMLEVFINEVKKIIAEAPAGKKENWEVFKDYLEEKAPKIFENVKNLGKLVDFIIERMNK